VVVVNAASDDREIAEAVQKKETVGVAVSADALAEMNKSTFLRCTRRADGGGVPFLILGVGPDVDPKLLQSWTGGAVVGGSRFHNLSHPEYMYGRVADGSLSQLTGLRITGAIADGDYLILGEESTAQSIMSVRDIQQVFRLFIVANLQQQEVFVASKRRSEAVSPDSGGIVSAFLRVAPEVMFVKHCAGERGWHAPYHYANLTIDDPWLRQPYGLLDYQGLLKEMERHNFHTTIAFIPWNYDRSEREVVSLFRRHPERLSIAIHGNNHDHKEFTNYHSKSFEEQTADLAESLARMERFQALTGIPYDKVMIFPHSIAPQGTLEALRKYNFIATVNSSNVPEGSTTPPDELFPLRSVTLSFGGIPSLSRYPVAAPISQSLLAIQGFLDNPFLFYAHSDLFATGINAFDRVADDVNRVEPDVRWRGLGDIVKHLYFVKLRPDSNYDVLALSNSVVLDNPWGRDVVLYVQKQEPNAGALNRVELDGQSYPYQLENGFLCLNIRLPKGTSRNLTIQYENDLLVASAKSRSRIEIYLLRRGSDFRDIYLGRFKLGLAVIRIYNQHNLKPWQVLAGLSILLLLCILAGYGCYRFIKTRRRQPLSAQKWSAVN